MPVRKKTDEMPLPERATFSRQIQKLRDALTDTDRRPDAVAADFFRERGRQTTQVELAWSELALAITKFRGQPGRLIELLAEKNDFAGATLLTELCTLPGERPLKALVEALDSDPDRLEKLLLSPVGQGREETAVWNLLLERAAESRDVFAILTVSLIDRPDLLREILRFDLEFRERKHSLNSVLNGWDEPDYGKASRAIQPLAFFLLDACRGHPGLLRDFLMNDTYHGGRKSHRAVIDSPFLWEMGQGLKHVFEMFQEHPLALQQVLAVSKNIRRAATGEDPLLRETLDGALEGSPHLRREIMQAANRFLALQK